MHKLNQYVVLLIIILAVGGVATIIRGWLYTLVGERLVRKLRVDLFHKIVNQDMVFFDLNKTGELCKWLITCCLCTFQKHINDTHTTNVSPRRAHEPIIQRHHRDPRLFVSQYLYAAEMAVSIVLLFITSWRLTCVMMAVVPALMFVVIIYGKIVFN